MDEYRLLLRQSQWLRIKGYIEISQMQNKLVDGLRGQIETRSRLLTVSPESVRLAERCHTPNSSIN